MIICILAVLQYFPFNHLCVNDWLSQARGASTSDTFFLFPTCRIEEFSTHIFNRCLSNVKRLFVDNSTAEPTTFITEKYQFFF